MQKFIRENGKCFIDGKEVSENAYTSMIEEELSKVKNHNSDKTISEECCDTYEEICPECQFLADFINDLLEKSLAALSAK